MIAAVYGCQITTLAVNQDSSAGVIARFRTMPISPSSMLNGYAAGALVRTLVSMALVIGVAIGWASGPPQGRAGGWRRPASSSCSCSP